MALTINTNLSAIVAQRNLNNATTTLNTAIERMTTGYKINHAGDNAAGYSIAKRWETQLSSLDVAADNAATGADLLSTMEDNYSLISTHLQRVRDLTEQAANGTYGTDSIAAIKSEITARLDEITRISNNCEFNGIDLMTGTGAAMNIQVGLDSTADSRINLDGSLFAAADSVTLFKAQDSTLTTIDEIATKASSGSPSAMLDTIDNVIKNISNRVTKLGAAQNRIDSAIDSIAVQSENITSSLSTLRDADIATESSRYIQSQILQQAAATLLSTANQSPSIALNLI